MKASAKRSRQPRQIPRRFAKKGGYPGSRPLRKTRPRPSWRANSGRLTPQKATRLQSRLPKARGPPGLRKPRKRATWRPLHEMVRQRTPPSVRRPRPSAKDLQPRRPRGRRPLLYYASLIAATPTRQDATTRAVNIHARREQRRIRTVTYADQQAQRRAQWRAEADAIARHWQRHYSHVEEIRRVKEGLRAEAKARDPGAPGRRLALYRQLAAIMGSDRR